MRHTLYASRLDMEVPLWFLATAGLRESVDRIFVDEISRMGTALTIQSQGALRDFSWIWTLPTGRLYAGQRQRGDFDNTTAAQRHILFI